jgi:hypothetical protein
VRTLFTVIAILSGLVFAAAITYFVDGVLHHLSSGWSPFARRSLGVTLGILFQAGLFMAPFQRTPSGAKRVVLSAMMLPCFSMFFTMIRNTDFTQQGQLVMMIAAAFGLVVYGVAIVYVWTRPYAEG